MYVMAPPTRSLSVFETRRSVMRPPSRRRKFGSSFIVETIVRFAPPRGDSVSAAAGFVRSGPRAGRAFDAAPLVRRFLALDAACERADCVLTYADLQVGAWVERRTMVTQAAVRPGPAERAPDSR